MPKRAPRSKHTEVVCTRIDQKLAFAVRLAAEAAARRSGVLPRLSDYLAVVLKAAAQEQPVAIDSEVHGGEEPQQITAWELAERIWHPDPSRVLCAQATVYPESLSQHEA